jgi:sec-independent protein translocase protein TatB
MFDISWSELLILGLVTLIFVGPKELPRFLGTLGRYAGVVRRQANEFRAVFEQAMREAEMEELKKEVRSVSDGVKASLDDATRSVNEIKQAAKVDTATAPKTGTDAVATADAGGSTPPAPAESADASAAAATPAPVTPMPEAEPAKPAEAQAELPSRPV